MPALHRTISVTRTAHLHQLGTLSKETKHLWMVCHGYGQLAKYFIRHFEVLVNSETVVIAPEALSRFYLNGVSGRVGASWMTKEERLTEIQDYIAYLDQVRAMALAEAPNAQLQVLGFSQGAATVCRWLAQAQVPLAELVLWAGIFPEDLELTQANPSLTQAKLSYVYGLQDEYVVNSNVQAQLDRVHAAGLSPKVITFEGGHELNPDVLRQLAHW